MRVIIMWSKLNCGSTVSKSTMVSYAIDKHGKPYRSFKLVFIGADTCTPHSAVNRLRQVHVPAAKRQLAGIGPQRAARKIFSQWCRARKEECDGDCGGGAVAPRLFHIVETTRGSCTNGKIYAYIGSRSAVAQRCVTHSSCCRHAQHGYITQALPLKRL